MTYHAKGNLHLSGKHWSSSQSSATGVWSLTLYAEDRPIGTNVGYSNSERALCVRRSGKVVESAELADLTSKYDQLTKKHAQMLDLYSRAFATAKERAALQDLIAVLGQMVANRDRAAALGDKTAATQLIKCQAEAEKYKRK